MTLMAAAPDTPVSAGPPAESLPETGWLLYDGACGFCTATAHRVQKLIARRGYVILPLQTPWVRERLGLRDGEPLSEMVVLLRDGRRFGGADAVVHLAGHFWWSLPLTALARLPGARRLLRRAYTAIAARRGCLGGACRRDPTQPSR